MRRAIFAVMAMSLLAACSRAHVQTSESYMGPQLPPPDHVLVSYFAVSPDQVRLDRGVGPRLMRGGNDPAGAQTQAARATQAALADQLVDRLRHYGLPAELAGAPGTTGSALLVQGQFVAIDQGNRTRRVVIGLGAGKSTVSADAQLYYYASDGAQPRFISALQGNADSGRMPGAAGTMGVGSVAGRLATSAAVSGATHVGAESRRTGDTAEAASLADGLARQIGEFAVAQGWIPRSAVR